MRFLFLTTRYSIDAADPYMIDELAEGLIAGGHMVDVLLVDWDAASPAQICEIEGRNGEHIQHLLGADDADDRAGDAAGATKLRQSDVPREQAAAFVAVCCGRDAQALRPGPT